MAGHRYPPIPVAYTTRDALLFANSIGVTSEELHFLYEKDPDFEIFPTFPTVLAHKGVATDVTDTYANPVFGAIPGAPKLDERRAVDGEKAFRFLRPLPPASKGLSLELRRTVCGVYDKGKPGTVVEVMTDLVDAATGIVYSSETGSAFFIGQGGWGGPRGPVSVTYDIPPHGRKPDRTFCRQIGHEAALLYRLNGDYNPLHAEPGPGEAMGFGGAIIHGLATWNMVCHDLLRSFGDSKGQQLKEFRARFSSPVQPGTAIVTEAWLVGYDQGHGAQVVYFQTKTARDTLVLRNGRALIGIPNDSKSLRL